MQSTSSSFHYPVAPWTLTADRWQSERALLEETLFAQANGYVGTRGSMEEGHQNPQCHCEGTYLNGVYSSEPITYGEVAYGYASHNQKMLQVPNGKVLQIELDGQIAHIEQAEVSQRTLDFASATLNRSMSWTSPAGKELDVTTQRFVSLAAPNLICIKMQCRAINFSGQLTLRSLLDSHYGFAVNKDDPRVGQLNMADNLQLLNNDLNEHDSWVVHQVKDSDFQVCSAVAHQLPSQAKLLQTIETDTHQGHNWQIDIEQGQTITIIKYVSYQHSRDGQSDTLIEQNNALLKHAMAQGWDGLFAAHQAQVKEFWHNSDVSIDGDDALQQGMRFNLLHLFMSSGRNGYSNIAAKGLTGHGYDGHYFWDSEVYVMSFLVATNPDIARQFLAFRYHTLDGARNRARQMSHNTGALYPWRTIGGDECSAFFPAGTAQYHINSAIAHAIKMYYQATGDWRFICEQGAEMLFETARLWLSLGHYSEAKNNQFCLDTVTGPDEYSALVNNNFYTNAMAQQHLQFALQVAAKLEKQDQTVYQDLCRRIKLDDKELSSWQKAADNMYLGYDERLGIHAQDDTFLAQKKWDFATTPADHYPLLLHYHPLVIYRHQVLKQADVVLAMYMLDDKFSKEQKARNLAYYEPLTTHDSTLSSCIHSIEYAEVGEHQRAYEFFHDTVRMDLDNRHGNTEYGVHTACMAGSWMSIVNGFAGLRYRQNQLSLAPYLPQGWRQYRINLHYQQRHIVLTIDQHGCSYELLSGATLTVLHHGQPLILQAQQTTRIEHE